MQTLFIVKPDAVSRNLTGQIIARIEASAFEIHDIKMVVPSKIQVMKHYYEHTNSGYFKELLDTMVGLAMIVGITAWQPQPSSSIARFRELMGPYSPLTKGTLRGDFAVSPRENSVHGSSSEHDFDNERRIWFLNG